MRRVLLLALGIAACSRGPPPAIDSFTVDQTNPDVGAVVTFSYSVRGASTVRIDPAPGVVHGSPVMVVPPVSGTYTLRVHNDDGVEATSGIAITLRPLLAINVADATPGQVPPGTDVNLIWSTTSAGRVTLTDGSTGQVSDVAPSGSAIVRPAATTIYTLTAYNSDGRRPASVSAKMAARVGVPPSVSDFIATPATTADNPMTQGGSVTLTWNGNAVSYSVSDGTTTFNVGPRRSLLVRPAVTTTYTLHAVGPGGTLANPPTVTVNVASHPATSLTYTGSATAPLQLVADACSPCDTLTLRIKATTTVQLRGLAFNLPLDATKVSFDPSLAAPGPALAGATWKATMGSGPLQDVLVFAVALEGTGTAPAADVTLNAGDEAAHFTLQLISAGGSGPVFDGAAPGVGYKAVIQSASGRSAGAIAVGRLDAN